MFTVGEAQTLLPVLEALIRRAQGAARRAGELDEEMQSLSRRIFLAGGMRVDVSAEARRRAERDKSAQEVKSAVEEIGEIGVRVQDLDAGVLDFPCMVNGETVLLCWRVGEPAILHWHGESDGYDKRRSLELLFGKNGRERPN
jgi:hypothetical protein